MILLSHLASIHYQVLDERHHNKLGNPSGYQANTKQVHLQGVASIPESWLHKHRSK
jgi:hypothetical protein